MPDHTTNHGYQLFANDEFSWEHRTDFQALDADVEIRDTDANKSNYEAKDGAKYVATDTHAVYLGDGTNWTAVTFKPTADHIADTSNPHSVTNDQVSAPSQTEFDNHTGDTTNPHSVTNDQVSAPSQTEFDTHTGDTTNPHSVTNAQVSAPSQTEFDNHTGNTSNPHSVTASQASALPNTGGSVSGNVSLTSGAGLIHQQRGAPTTTELADGERMQYVSDGSDSHAAGDLVSARNNAGTIVSQVIAAAADDA